MNTGEKEERHLTFLTFANHQLCTDWFIHIFMYSLHENPAISFSLQMKKLRIITVQSSGVVGRCWEKVEKG